MTLLGNRLLLLVAGCAGLRKLTPEIAQTCIFVLNLGSERLDLRVKLIVMRITLSTTTL
jgi:hypothetical protein